MKIFSRLLFVALPLAASAHAEVPVYRNHQLDVPSAVVLTAKGPVYYGDIRFKANQDGSFSLLEANRRNLAQIYTTAVSVDLDLPLAETHSTGILSNACVVLEEPAVVREGNTFYVVLAETAQDPQSVCMSLIAVKPFNIEVYLDLTGLEDGEYTVDVNGVTTSFVLSDEHP